MAGYPTRGTKPWDTLLREYIDYIAAASPERVAEILAENPEVIAAAVALAQSDVGLIRGVANVDGAFRLRDQTNHEAFAVKKDGTTSAWDLLVGRIRGAANAVNKKWTWLDQATPYPHTMFELRPSDGTVLAPDLLVRRIRNYDTGLPFVSGSVKTRLIVQVPLGQSLAEGRGRPYNARLDPPRSDILMWNWGTQNFSPLTVPNSSQQTSAGMSPVNVIAAQASAEFGPETQIVVMNLAAGGSALVNDVSQGNWGVAYAGANPRLWTIAKAQINAARPLLAARFPGLTPEFWAYWEQGESDADVPTATYQTAYLALIDAFRTFVGDPNAPWTAGGMVPEHAKITGSYATVRPALIAAQSSREHVGYADGIANSGGSADPTTDEVHMARDGVERLGRAMWQASRRATVNDSSSAAAGNVPHEPLDVSATFINGTLTATWTFPMCRLTEFVAQYRLNGGSWITVDMTTAAGGLLDTMFSVTGLAAGVAEVQVAGKSGAAVSDFSTSVFALGA